MEGVETVDVSWLHHSQKDHISRCKSASSQISDKSIPDAERITSQPCNAQCTTSLNTNAPPPPREPFPSAPDTLGNKSGVSDRVGCENGNAKDEKSAEAKASESSQTPQKSAPRSITGRRNSWISSISSKFSSGSTPPSQPSMKQPSPKAVSPISKMDTHNPFGAAYFPKDKEDEKRDEPTPLVSTSPKGPSFLQSAFRKFSSSSSGKPVPNRGICERRVMNIDRERDRCRIPDLDQKKMRRVAFCVDVEIAGISRRGSDEEGSPGSSKRHDAAEPNCQKVKRSNSKSKNREEAGTPKNQQPVTDDKGRHEQDNSAPTQTASSSATHSKETKSNGETKEPTRKQEKKKRSEEERRERKERKRRQAEANGTVPMQLSTEDLEDDPRAVASGNARSKTQSHPTTDPVRIYRRCCQLRETPVLKKVVDEISSPSSTLAESPGTVAVLDLTNFPMTPEDTATFCDWLAIVPVRKLILEKCALNDTSVRTILAALLSTKTVEQMRQRRRRSRKSDIQSISKEDRFCVVEKLSLKDNPRIGPEGWRHISLFIHLAKSLKAIDLSGIPLPKIPIPAIDLGTPIPQTPNPTTKSVADATAIFANSLAQRFGGDYLEELLLSECDPTTEDVEKICEAATTLGLRRLGLANNNLSREGLQHVVRYLEFGKCEGLDLGGNPISEHLDLITSALEADFPLYALSLADCSLTPSIIHPLLQRLTCLYNLRFIDFSHNPDLFSSKPDALATFRRFLPKMAYLKRIHLADVNLAADHAIALAEILPECPSLCHLNILENPAITRLAAATDPATQEEACAVYASLMAAVRVSRTIIAVDIEVPTAENNEVVKALGSQIVAYCLQNLERGAIEEELSDPTDTSVVRDTVPVPEILQHLVGSTGGDEICEDDVEPAPDEDYVIGGTGVVKALEVCLGTLHHRDMLGDQSGPPSGTTTPRQRKSRSFVPKRPRDMSKNLLYSARNIRIRIQSALVREDRAGNDANYRRLQFLDFTLQRMIQRFEDEYPETCVKPPSVTSAIQETSSQNSGDDVGGAPSGNGQLFGMNIDENAIDDEETDQFALRLSRASSITSLHSRAMTSEEGHVHRLGQNLRRDFLSPSLGQVDDDGSATPLDDSHLAALRDKLDRLHVEQTRSHFEGANADKAFEELGSTVEELWAIQTQDTEAFERFRQSQIAAQINSGKRNASLMPANGRETKPTSN
ncbi:putative cell wall biogenesis protein Mhp1 [Aspergillus clavatus NRRL 1]|uniref:Cell wall biogenesis protein Mhp1, putative n=1 Tax=Aspergillus clavatus (strain ATCC 1007 / CBS 513.65 / DSM 816 / NCTC 3887 / NRRL 1 / QM 1276 / 107) TaxID=344612 RepID=A1CPH1_ASPCL|nr:cell wall biogenesis protein Mhp1, putative [Aspergillus clavatus NRRL 1]EAW07542.1 cell wall biogenesis protein Mhp1, putative [Aspergillus clavatus NRRL 1]